MEAKFWARISGDEYCNHNPTGNIVLSGNMLYLNISEQYFVNDGGFIAFVDDIEHLDIPGIVPIWCSEPEMFYDILCKKLAKVYKVDSIPDKDVPIRFEDIMVVYYRSMQKLNAIMCDAECVIDDMSKFRKNLPELSRVDELVAKHLKLNTSAIITMQYYIEQTKKTQLTSVGVHFESIPDRKKFKAAYNPIIRESKSVNSNCLKLLLHGHHDGDTIKKMLSINGVDFKIYKLKFVLS